MASPHEPWCPLDHRPTTDGSFERVLCVISENAGWDGEAVVDWVVRERANDRPDPGEHVYLRVGDFAVGSYGYHSSDLARQLNWLWFAVDLMAEHERALVKPTTPDSEVVVGHFATHAERRPESASIEQSADALLDEHPWWCSPGHAESGEGPVLHTLPLATIDDGSATVEIRQREFAPRSARSPVSVVLRVGHSVAHTWWRFTAEDSEALARMFFDAGAAMRDLEALGPLGLDTDAP